MPEPVIEKFRKQLNVFSAKLELFDGTSDYNIIDFVSDLNSYCEYLGKDQDSEKLSVLKSHLTGEAKIVFRLVKDPNFENVISALKLRFAPTEQALHRVKAELFGTKQMSGETFKHFAIRLQKTARHTDISELDLVQIAITGARNDNLRSHLLMAAPANMNSLIKLPVVCNDDLYSNASLEQISLLTATVSQLKSQVAQLSKSANKPASHVTDRAQDRVRAKPPADRARKQRRMDPYRHQPLCKRCDQKSCQGSRLCVAYNKICRQCGKMGHFKKCCYNQPSNYFNAKHWRWLPIHKMGRPQPGKLASVESSGASSSVNQSKEKSNSTHSNKQQTKTKQKQKNKLPEVKTEPIVIQYQVDVHDLTRSSDYNVEILNNETSTSHCAISPYYNMLHAKFGVLQTQALCDTGATISCVSQAFLDKIPRKFVKRLPDCNIIIHGVGNFQKRVREQVELSFTIDGRKFTEKFYALPNSHNVILGLCFLSKYKAIVNLSEAEITLDGQIFKLQRPSTRSSLAKLCHNEIIPAYTNKAVQIKLTKPVISDSMFLSALSSMERNHPDITFVNTIIANQHTLCRIINNSSEPIALSKGTAVALARNIHSNDVLEMTDFFETVPTSDNDSVDCECKKCLSHDNLQQNEGESETGSANSDIPPGGGLQHPATRVHPTLATRGPGHSTSEPGQARSNQDGGTQQKQTRSAGEVSTQSNSKFIVNNNPKAVKLQLKCKCNSKNDLTCDQFDFSTALNTLFMDIPAHNPNVSVMNTDVSNNLSADQEFQNHQKLHTNSFKCRLKNQNSANGAKLKKQSQNGNKLHQKVEVNSDTDPFDKVLKFKINPNFSSDVKMDFDKFLQGNRKRFSTCKKEMGYNDLYPHYMATDDEKPVPLRYNRMSPKLQKVLDDEIEDLLRHGFIEPSSSSWRSPVVLVRKPHSDEYRLCVDYRLTNAKSTPEAFPTITLEEIWEIIGIHRPALFSKLDLMSGFLQLAMHPDTKHKSTFVVRGNSYQWNRLPFGLRNSPITFQKTMAEVLKGLLFKTCLIYLDDIIVWGDCLECHKKNLQEVFDRLEKANLTLKASKCEFAMEEITYVGHILSSAGVRPNPEKVSVVKNFPTPKNVKQLRQFLGLSQYYRRFQKNFAQISKTLYDLTRKDIKWDWTEEREKAFQTLKNNLITPPILAYPDPNRPYIISTDASMNGLGYVLSQKDEHNLERVIAYSGRALRKAEKNYSITELEALSVVAAFKQFHPYIYGNFVTLRTDHKALQYIYKNKTSKGRLMRWVLELMNYDYEIEHKPGIQNGAADAISRLPEYPKSTENQPEIPGDPHIMSVSTPNFENEVSSSERKLQKFDWLQVSIFDDNDDDNVDINMLDNSDEYCFDIKRIDIIAEQKSCDEIGPWYQFIKTGNVPPDVEYSKAKLSTADQYAIKDGILVHLFQPRTRNMHRYHPITTQIVVPKKLRAQLLSEFHDSLMGSHQSFDRVYQAIRQRFYWPRMYEDIHEYYKTCRNCQRASTHHPKRPPLNPLPVTGLFERLQMDYLGPFRKSKCGKRWILLVVDSFSGWCEAFALPNADAVTTAKVLYSEIFTRYGAPRHLLSDRGANFLSSLVQALCDIFSVHRVKTSSYHPASNSKCEKFNAFINKSLRTMVDDSQENWPELIPGIMMAYRSTPARGTNFSPYFLCFAKEMTTPIETQINPDLTEVAPNYRDTLKSFIDNVRVARQIAHENILRNQQHMKQYYDRKATPPKYKLGDMVWLHDPTTPVGFSRKLKPRWRGPYRISEIGPNATYRLRHYTTDLPTNTLINAQRIKPAFLPWESRIRREDPDNRGLQRNPQAAPPPQNERQKKPTAATQLRNNNILPPAAQQSENNNTRNNNKSGQGKYHNTHSEIHKPATPATQQQPNSQLKVEKVVDLKLANKIRWYRVKLKGLPGFPWYRHGSIEIPQKLVEECLKTRTWAGTRRKKKNQKVR